MFKALLCILSLSVSAAAAPKVYKTSGEFERCVSKIGPSLPNSFDPDVRVKTKVEECSIGNQVSNVNYVVSKQPSGLYLIDIKYKHGLKSGQLKHYFSSNAEIQFNDLNKNCNIKDPFVNLAQLERKILNEAVNTIAHDEFNCEDPSNQESVNASLPGVGGFLFLGSRDEGSDDPEFSYGESKVSKISDGSFGFKKKSDGSCGRICPPGQTLLNDPSLTMSAQIISAENAGVDYYEISRCMKCPVGYETNSFTNECLDKSGCPVGTQMRKFEINQDEDGDYDPDSGLAAKSRITKASCMPSCEVSQEWDSKNNICTAKAGQECTICKERMENLQKVAKRNLSNAPIGTCTGSQIQELWSEYINPRLEYAQETYEACLKVTDPAQKKNHCIQDPLEEPRRGNRNLIKSFGDYLYDDTQDEPFGGVCKPPKRGEPISSDAMEAMTMIPDLKFSMPYRQYCKDQGICK